MDEPDPPVDQLPPPRVPLRRRLGRHLFDATCLLCLGLTGVWLARLVYTGEPLPLGRLVQMGAAGAATLFCLVLLIRRPRFSATSRLLDLLAEVRAGRAAIDELSDVGGELSRLVPQIQDLLHELRGRRLELDLLHEEIRQRIRQRTSALERTINTLRIKATRDPLTGLGNRRMLDEMLPQLIERCSAENVELCLLMIDVDHFKLLNDTLGHAAGDELLRGIGQLVRSVLKEGDLGFRNGGDEFVLLLIDCDADGGRATAQRLRSLFEALARPLKVPQAPALSIGLGLLRELTEVTPQGLLRRADEALYAEKNRRRAG